ncbi:MAG TPA: acetate--CoA ligase family protein, partial [Actinopolymorphaceae bacterium]
GRQRQRRLVRQARAYGLRVIGPSALGVINNDQAVALNASLSPVVPERGRVGFFCQSGPLGTVILRTVADRGLGLSTFVSAGNRADVSGNDLMQYWQEDAATDVVLLYLESVGNPRKFSRIARRLSEVKPVVAVRSGRFTQSAPLGHTVRVPGVPQAAVDAMFRQAGVIVVDTLEAMLDVAQLLTYQPLPAGERLGIVGNSDALALLAVDAAAEHGLTLAREALTLPPDIDPADLAERLDELVTSDEVDAVVVAYALPVDLDGRQTAHAIAQVARHADKPVVATFLGSSGVPEPLRPVPSYGSPGAAVAALAHAAAYARWRRRPRGREPDLPDIDDDRARDVVREVLSGAAGTQGVELEPAQVATLLSCYGIEVLPAYPVSTVEEAIGVGEEIGWSQGRDVVLKATAPHLRQRPDLADVRRDIGTAEEMRDAWEVLAQAVGSADDAGFVVQTMAAPGVPVTVAGAEDPAFGPVVSFGVAGVATDLLGDFVYRVPPLTDVDAAGMVREIKAAPLLSGHRGGDLVNLAAVEDLLLRVGRMTHDLPELGSVELVPVLANARGATVLGASARLVPASRHRTDWYARRLTRL